MRNRSIMLGAGAPQKQNKLCSCFSFCFNTLCIVLLVPFSVFFFSFICYRVWPLSFLDLFVTFSGSNVQRSPFGAIWDSRSALIRISRQVIITWDAWRSRGWIERSKFSRELSEYYKKEDRVRLNDARSHVISGFRVVWLHASVNKRPKNQNWILKDEAFFLGQSRGF